MKKMGKEILGRKAMTAANVVACQPSTSSLCAGEVQKFSAGNRMMRKTGTYEHTQVGKLYG